MKNNKKGFTLVELIVVIAIMAAIISIGVPLLLNHAKKAQETARQSNAKIIYDITCVIFLDEPELVDLMIEVMDKDPLMYKGAGKILESMGKDENPSLKGDKGSEINNRLNELFEIYGFAVWPDDDLNLFITPNGEGITFFISYKENNEYYPNFVQENKKANT